VSNELHIAPSDEFPSTIASREVEKLETSTERFLSMPALAEHYGVNVRKVKTWREKGWQRDRVGRKRDPYEVAA
jgi:uncharacterized protein YjcR